MRRARRGGLRALGVIAVLAIATTAGAQPFGRRPPSHPIDHTPRPPPPGPTSDDPTDLRGRFGVERAAHLLRSADEEDRLRGIERAAGLGTPDAVSLLIQQLDALAPTRSDARAKIAIARGLAAHTDNQAARAALTAILALGTPRPSSQKPDADEPLFLPRLDVARRIAALALVQSGDPHAIEALVAVARSTTPGAAAAEAALVAFPPSGTALWAKPVTASGARLVARTGDRRAAGDLLEAANGDVTDKGTTSHADAATRAAAIEALAVLGDARVVAIAARTVTDDDARVRMAATSALVTMGAPDAPHAVEQLLADDATAARGISLALVTHSPGIVHALAARAAAAADLAVRSATVAALGRDPSNEGIDALAALMEVPLLRADAADAIARSPSPTAMRAIERLASGPAASAGSRRLAARAYVVRALVRDEASGALDHVVAELARSADASDRAVGVFVRSVLGRSDFEAGLGDPDPAVRRAAALAALAQGSGARTRSALLARRAVEPDAPTRAVLAIGLLGADAAGQTPTRALLGCAHAGGADAPLCAFALAARSSASDALAVDALLSSRDPVLRAHAARGLALSDDPTRAGRLVAAYAYEPDALVRLAIVTSLGALPHDTVAAASTLALAARLDPDPPIRAAAGRLAAAREPSPPALASEADGAIAWIHLANADGSPPVAGETASLLRPDGFAVPVAFDADGDALVPGLPPGGARLVLAPRPSAAYSEAP